VGLDANTLGAALLGAFQELYIFRIGYRLSNRANQTVHGLLCTDLLPDSALLKAMIAQ
jgi:hypothetical protein